MNESEEVKFLRTYATAYRLAVKIFTVIAFLAALLLSLTKESLAILVVAPLPILAAHYTQIAMANAALVLCDIAASRRA